MTVSCHFITKTILIEAIGTPGKDTMEYPVTVRTKPVTISGMLETIIRLMETITGKTEAVSTAVETASTVPGATMS